MKISGFTMGKNASRLYYPMKESILSILPLVDEMVIVLGDNDPEDNSRALIESIQSPKIRIIDTVWDIEKYNRGTEMAHQTDIAKSHCTGDWLFYIQADEVFHEKYHETVKLNCQKYLDDPEVEGFLFRYLHFWGDYDHCFDGYGWYPSEIRLIRNDPEIHSWRDAQSFRRIPGFDGRDYRQEKGTFKLKVVKLDATMYHYGWVRPPHILKSKIREFRILQRGKQTVEWQSKNIPNYNNYDYGVLNRVPRFEGTHPAVLKEWISRFDWADQLQYSGKRNKARQAHKHERVKYRLRTWIEKNLLFGRSLGGFKNYILLKRK